MTITKKQAAQIAGIHEKTLERFLHENRNDILTRSGYQKNQMNGRINFDETLFRAFFADLTGNDAIRSGADGPEDSIDGEIITGSEMVQIERRALAVPEVENVRRRPGNDPFNAFLIPHKLWLTVDEAKALTSFPKTVLRGYSQLIHGRRLIARSKLDKIKG